MGITASPSPTPTALEVGEKSSRSSVTACATFYAIQGGNDLYWRVEAPAQAVGAKAVIIPEVGGYYALTQPNNDTAFRWRFDPDADTDFIDYPAQEGPVAVWTRPDLCRASHAKAMRHLGIRTIAEVDDNYLSDPHLNIFMRTNRFDAQGRLDHMKATCSMNGIIVSTRWLADLYRRELGAQFGKRSVPPIFVCRNHVALEQWPERVERTGPLRVGWMGSPSHVWDVDLAWPAMLYANRRGCETWMIGYDPTDISEHAGEKSRGKAAQWRKVGFQHVPWQKPADHHRFPLPLDIGLCPLLSNTHTLGKSDVKAVEYTISGAAVVAQNNEVYSRDWIHGETALLAGSPQELLDAVERLIRDENLRLRLVANAQQYVREYRGLKQMREEWGEAIGGVEAHLH